MLQCIIKRNVTRRFAITFLNKHNIEMEEKQGKGSEESLYRFYGNKTK